VEISFLIEPLLLARRKDVEEHKPHCEDGNAKMRQHHTASKGWVCHEQILQKNMQGVCRGRERHTRHYYQACTSDTPHLRLRQVQLLSGCLNPNIADTWGKVFTACASVSSLCRPQHNRKSESSRCETLSIVNRARRL
jgi:hypothetical protein